MKLDFTPETLYFKRPFKIAHGSRDSTPIVITRISWEGCTGFGEASMPPYLGETQESCAAFLRKASTVLSGLSYPFDMEQVLAEIDALSEKDTAAKASIDIALHDLQGKLEGMPCWERWKLNKEDTPYTTYTIGIDTKEVIQEKIRESADYRYLKVKLDGMNDREMIGTVRNHTDKPIAVDVNQGWKDKETAIRMIEWMKDMNVIFVEQPLAKDDPEGMAWLYSRSPLPLFADESVQRLSDVEGIQNLFHGINIKLMKSTGMNEAFKMIAAGRKYGLSILIGCMSESSCGVSAAAQLSPLADHADLDGPLLIRNDPFEGMLLSNGKITLSGRAGIGVMERRTGLEREEEGK